MKQRFRATYGDRFLIESSTKYDKHQLDDMNQIIKEFGNLILREVKANPQILDEIELPEPTSKVLS